MEKLVFFAATKLHRSYFAKITVQQPTMSLCWFKSVTNGWPFIRYDWRLLAIVEQASHKTDNGRGRLLPPGAARLYRWVLVLKSMWLYNSYFRFLSRQEPTTSIVWNGLKYRQQLWCLCCEQLGIQLRYMENGLLSGFTTLDAKGVNFGNSLPREADFYRTYGASQTENPLDPAATTVPPSEKSLPERFVFVPLQVNGDSQIVCYSPWIQNMAHLVSVLIAALPAFQAAGLEVVVKPHPKCSTPNAKVLARLKTHGVTVVTDTDSKRLVAQSQAVLTINSTVGLEALAAGKKVIVLGQAFYRIEGISLGAINNSELQAAIGQLAQWAPDIQAVSGLMNYLRQEYQIKGDWRTADAAHIQCLLNRLEQFNGAATWQ